MDKRNHLLIGGLSRDFGTRVVSKGLAIEATHPEASFWLEGGVTAAGTGFVWGHGEIHYRGNNHPFRLSALSIDNVAAASISAAGSVLELRSLSDFSGHYLASRAGSIRSAGDNATYLKNERGVVITLTATDPALRVKWPVVGLRVKLKRRKSQPSVGSF